MRSRGRARFVGVGLGVACGALLGCEALEEGRQPNIRIPNPKVGRKDVLIHVVRGHLSEKESRGGASTTSRTRFSKGPCKDHPKVKGVPRIQNWDVIYDEELAERWAEKYRIGNPVDVVLYHELFGHIIVVSKNPEMLDGIEYNEKLKADLEKKSREIENRYRRYRPVPLPEVPEYLSESANP